MMKARESRHIGLGGKIIDASCFRCQIILFLAGTFFRLFAWTRFLLVGRLGVHICHRQLRFALSCPAEIDSCRIRPVLSVYWPFFLFGEFPHPEFQCAMVAPAVPE